MVTAAFCDVSFSCDPLKSANMPNLLIRLLGIMASTLLLLGCATDLRESRRSILQPWAEINSARIGMPSPGLSAQTDLSPSTNQVILRRPAAISAHHNDVYLLDAGLRRIFRYDSFSQTLTPFASTLSADAGMSIYVASDLSVYVTDPNREQVLHFNRDGSPLPSLIARGNMARPVSVLADERYGQVLVADGLFNRIVVFDNFGRMVSVFKPFQVLAIAAMTSGPDGIYVIDRLAKRIVVLGWDGSFRYAFGTDALSEPGAIAVSRDNLVFISDNFEHTISIYRRQHAKGNKIALADKIGGGGITPGSFNRIGGLAVADDLLYATDSLNARVQVLMINPHSQGK